MARAFLLILLLLFLFSCGRKTTPTVTKEYSALKFTQLIADNISEETTGEDEVYLIFMAVKQDSSSSVIISESNHFFIFKKEDSLRKETISYGLTLPEETLGQTFLYTFLIESDTTKSVAEIVVLIKNVFEEERYQFSDSLSSKVSSVLKDDDLLGMSCYKFSTLSKKENRTISFSGINLFDKYFYRLKYTLK